MKTATFQSDFGSWRAVARKCLDADVPPEQVLWEPDDLITDCLPNLATEDVSARVAATSTTAPVARVPAAFVDLCSRVACFRDLQRWALMYCVLWRLTHGEPHLLEVAVDDDVHRMMEMDKCVRRDRHKMTAFVRFRQVGIADDGAEQFVAFHRPDHLIVRSAAPFFAKRFAIMRWSILTPDLSAHWNPRGHDGDPQNKLAFSPGVPASFAPRADELEALWKTYYANIFNPARIKLSAMRAEMPLKHWPTLPETELIDQMLRDAPQRVEAMIMATRRAAAHDKAEALFEGEGLKATAAAHARRSPSASSHAGSIARRDIGAARDNSNCESTGSAADFLPARISLKTLHEAATACRGCTLYCHATQVVFGEGPARAACMFVGEQPGDQEDRAGKPFVGPAGQLLDELLAQADIPRDEVYVTNAVKHFKFEARGHRRIHSKPSAREVGACKPWLEAEIQVVKPKMIVALGATAAQSLFGNGFRVTQHRGEPIETPLAAWAMATLHPSALLRMPDEAAKLQARADVLDDLRKVAKELKRLRAG